MKKSFTHIITFGILAFLFLPLLVSQSLYFPFITGKGFFFRAIVEVLFSIWAIGIVYFPEYRPRKSMLLTALTAFVVMIGIATIFSENPFKSFWSNYERMEGYVLILHLFAYFLVLASVFNTQKKWNLFFNTTLFVSFITIIYSLFQLGGLENINQGGTRVDALFGNATYFAGYLLFHLFISAFMYIRTNHTVLRSLYGALAVLQVTILFLTGTRGAAIGLVAGIFVSLCVWSCKGSLSLGNKKLLFGILTIFVLGIGTLFFVRNTPAVENHPILSRFASLVTYDDLKKNATPRFIIWNMAWHGFLERPLLGWGQESFSYVFNAYYSPALYNQEPWFDRAHNIFLDWLIAGGVFGLLFYLSLFESAYALIWRGSLLPFSQKVKERLGCWIEHDECYQFSVGEGAVLTGLLTAYFVQNLFVFDNLFTYVPFFSVLAFIHSSTAREWSFISKIDIRKTIVYVVYIPFIVIGTFYAYYFVVYKPIQASSYLIRALSSTRVESVETGIASFEKALALHTLGDQEVREQLMQFSINVIPKEIPDEVRLKLFNFTVNELQSQLQVAPHDARTYFFLGSFLQVFGEYEYATDALQEALKYAPNRQLVLYNLGFVASQQDLNDKAVAYFKQAFELDKRNSEARILYATALFFNDEEKKADALLNEAFGTTIVLNEDLLRTYLGLGYRDRAKALLEKFVVAFPDNATYKDLLRQLQS